VGSYGIYAFGDNAVIRNDGDIFAAQNYGIYSGASTAARLTNNGEISAYYGIYANGAGSVITNGADAEIDASYYGIYSSASAGTTRIANHGEVIVSEIGYAIYTGGANDRIVNDGRITGQVLVSDGNDSLDNRGGSISGPIYGGAGNDTLIVDKAAFKLTEISGEGEDTVKSTVSYMLSDFVERLILLGNKDIDGSGSAQDTRLDGNAGDNTLRGKAGIDNLFGHKGNDVLTGGADQDEFFFFKGDGIDTVTDFHNGEDKIALPDFAGINTFAQLSSHIEKHGGDVWIELGGGDRLVLLHVVKTDLDATDFDFAI
jgi:Ca2+-binding RTX toxin-like protein